MTEGPDLPHLADGALQALAGRLCPAAEPALACGEVALHYAPYEPWVGGDWCDVVELDPYCVAFVIGDIAGHGVDAARRAIALRIRARELLRAGDGPAEVLLGLERLVDGFATCLVALFDADARTVRWSSAGHLPAVVVRDGDGAEVLEGGVGVPLGLNARQRRDAMAPLDLGDVLLLYTDGLIERRGEPITESVERLRRAAGAGVAAPADLCARLVGGLERDGLDDVAVLAFAPGAPQPAMDPSVWARASLPSIEPPWSSSTTTDCGEE